MSLSVKSLNGDTCFLLTFSPPIAPLSSPGLFPGSFTILFDPWLSGSSTILSPKFSISDLKSNTHISSLKELDQEPDLVLISQDKPDHCHEHTLRQLPRDCESTILATPAAAKKVQSWNHFPPALVHSLKKYDEKDPTSIYRIILPPFSPRGSCGEVTIALMPAKRDLSRLHNAIGITYRPPCSVLSASPGLYLDLPMSPPVTPGSPLTPRTIASSPCTLSPSPYHDREKTLSVIYSPHGVSYDIIRPYASSHLVTESALPLTALIHSFDRVENPWYLGGNIAAGSPGGLEIARSLFAKAWVSAHDATKDNRGIAVKQTRFRQYAVDEVKRMLQSGPKTSVRTDVVSLMAGQEYHVGKG